MNTTNHKTPYRGVPDADHPAVSIIVPVWQDAKWVRRCLSSVVAQRPGVCCECIIVDDCGGDGSMAIVEEQIAANDDPQMAFRILRHSRNEGVSVARNDGIRAARGLYITFLDADDEWRPAFLRTLLRLALRYRFPDVVMSEIEEEGTYRMFHFPWPEYIPQREFMDYYVKGFVMPGARLLHRRLFRSGELFFIEGIRFEDEPWHFHESRLVKTVAATSKPLYIYHDNPTSYTRSQRLEDTSKYFNVIFRHLLDVVCRENEEELAAIRFKYIRTAIYFRRRLPAIEQMFADEGIEFDSQERKALKKL